jgi:hypothetical protein
MLIRRTDTVAMRELNATSDLRPTNIARLNMCTAPVVTTVTSEHWPAPLPRQGGNVPVLVSPADR